MPDQERTPGRPRYTKFFWKDFISDTQHLTATQLGAYVRLLAHAVMCSDDFCSIPEATSKQYRIAGVDPRNWARIGHDVRRLFGEPVSGRCQQKRLAEDASVWLQHCANKQKQRRDTDGKWTVDGPYARSREKSEVRSQKEEEPTHSSPNGEGRVTPKDWRGWFHGVFWPDYPKKVGKQEALSEWDRLCPKNGTDPEALLTEIMRGLGRSKTSGDWRRGFVMEPRRWLKQKRWQDEPELAVAEDKGWQVEA